MSYKYMYWYTSIGIKNIILKSTIPSHAIESRILNFILDAC